MVPTRSGKVVSLLVALIILIPVIPMVGGEDPPDYSNKNATLWGFVTDTHDNPIISAKIQLVNKAQVIPIIKNEDSGQGGYYSFDSIAPGIWEATVTKTGYFDIREQIKVHPGEILRHDFVMTKIPPITSSIRGKVINNDTLNPVPGAQVTLLDFAHNTTMGDTTNLLGNYNIDTYAGFFLIVVSKNGYLPVFMGGIHIEPDQILTLDITLFPTPPLDARGIGDITFKLADGSTGEVPYASVTVYDKSKHFFTEFKADEFGHYDITLYEGNYLFLVQDENNSFLDSQAKNVTLTSGGVQVSNFKLDELPPTKNRIEMNLTDWSQSKAVFNMTSWGRSDDGEGGGGARAVRFMVDVFMGNGDNYASNEELDVFLESFEYSIRNSFGLFDTKDEFTVDGIDFVFGETFDKFEMDASGSIFGERPQFIEFEITADANGTIDTDAPTHLLWFNFSYATPNQTEENFLHVDPQLKMINDTSSSNVLVEELDYGLIGLEFLLDPDPDDEYRSESFTIELVDRIPPTADAGENLTVDEDEPVELNASGSTDNFAIEYYTWDLGDGNTTNVSTPSTFHTYEQPGNYTVTLTVGDHILHEDTDEIWIEVLDITPPTIDILFNETEVEEDVELTFETNATDNVDIEVISWSVNDDHVDNGTSLKFTFDDPGSYSVKATANDLSGHSTEDIVQLTVTDETPPVADPGPDRTVNESDEVRLDASASSDNVGVTAHTWNFGDGSSEVTGKITTHKYDTPGNYSVTLNVTDAAGHSNEMTIWVLVKDITPPVAQIQGETSIEFGKKVKLNATASLDNVGVVDYLWDFGDGDTGSGEFVTHKYKETGDYELTLTVVDAEGQSNNITTTVSVVAPENPLAILFIIGLLLLLGVVGGIGSYMAYRKWRLGGYNIDEVFVIYKDGRLIRHISANPTESADKDVIAAMLTAVQDFVKESLKKSDKEHLGKLEFGKKTKILIERGKNMYLAVVLSGHDPEKLRGKLTRIVETIETDFKKKLKTWEGDPGAFSGLDERVIELMEK